MHTHRQSVQEPPSTPPPHEQVPGPPWHSHIPLTLGLAWVLACTAGAAIATFAGQFLAQFVLGLTLGAAQWLVLRPYLHHPRRSVQPLRRLLRILFGSSWDRRYGNDPGGALWLLASAVGGIVGFMLSIPTVSLVADWLTALAGRYEGSAYGFVDGTLQVAILGVAQCP